MTTASIRCFVAIEIPESIQNVFVEMQNALKSKINNASWVKLGNFHLTLRFLGDVKNEDIDEISNTIEGVALNHQPIRLDFGGIGAFPNLTRPNVLWVGLKIGRTPVTTLGVKLNKAMFKLDFKDERRFHPHVTLARLKNRVSLASSMTLFEKFDTLQNAFLTVNEILLVRSELQPSGAIYTPIKRFKLGREKVENGE